jgi:hypothetical protein
MPEEWLDIDVLNKDAEGAKTAQASATHFHKLID